MANDAPTKQTASSKNVGKSISKTDKIVLSNKRASDAEATARKKNGTDKPTKARTL